MAYNKKINNSTDKLKILIAPLNWGLGHITRCIPIIRVFEKENCEVILAADQDALLLLKKEFPSMVILPVFSYKVTYSRSKVWLPFKMISQLPKLAITISKEHKWLKNAVNINRPDIIISDNRFGMYNKDIISIYITHQLMIKTGNFFFDKIANRIHNNFIKKYDQCWIPDFKENGLAGELSHPKDLQSNMVYIGPLSRFEIASTIEKVYDLLISISGPEPQRTIFENIIFNQVKNLEKKVLVVRGLPAEKKKMVPLNSFVKIENHLSAEDLSIAFQQSHIVVCRSGYTTIMDLIKIHKEAILIPTPGQAEQEYLASYLMQKGNFLSVKQKDFSLEDALLKASTFPFIKRNDSMEAYKEIISEFVFSVKSGSFTSQY